jgi:putative hydrolase of the HAD superfamily
VKVPSERHKAVRAVIFDLMDTLAVMEPGALQALKQRCAQCLGVSTESYSRCWAETRALAAIGHFGSVENRCRRAVELLQLPRPVGSEEIEQIAQDEKTTWLRQVHLCDDALPCLRCLKSHGTRVAVVSNGSELLSGLPDQLGLSHLIDCFILSCDVGIAKPAPAIYQLALNELGVIPEACVYVGDGYDRELDGAQAVGIFAIKVLRVIPDYLDMHRQSESWNLEVQSLESLTQMISTDLANVISKGDLL